MLNKNNYNSNERCIKHDVVSGRNDCDICSHAQTEDESFCLNASMVL